MLQLGVSLAGRLCRPQVLDLLFACLSFSLFLFYHVWYYSWHLWPGGVRAGTWAPAAAHPPHPPGMRHRVDLTGQHARRLFTLVS